MLRRSLLRLMGALGLAPASSVDAIARPAAIPAAAGAPEAETLRAVARTVLPASLGPEHADRIVAGFRSWLRGYAAGADRGHGYGHARLATAPLSPDAGYASQLAALEAAARRKGVRDFASATAEDRRALIDAALAAVQVERLPDRPDGRHVAADLMAFFFRSSEANDLCYRAEIARDGCRGLADSEAAPARLSDAGTRRPEQTLGAGPSRAEGGS